MHLSLDSFDCNQLWKDTLRFEAITFVTFRYNTAMVDYHVIKAS